MFRLLIALYLVVVTEGSKQAEFSLNFNQEDYKIKPERAEVIRYDSNYMKQYEIKTFKYNRSTTAFNVSLHFKVDVGSNIEVVVQTYKFASNEYRLFPIRFEFNLCSAMMANAFGAGNQGKCGNITGCHMKKNRLYYLCNWTTDQSKYPPFIPTGRYMVEGQALYFSKEIFFTKFYGEVYRPFV